jgi:hypothetical protein
MGKGHGMGEMTWLAQPLFILSAKQKFGSSLTLNQTAKMAIPNQVVGDILIP